MPHNQPQPKRPMKLSTLVTLMVCSVIASVLLVVYAFYFVQITKATRAGVEDTAFAIARTLANSPEIKRGLAQSPDSNIIQPIASAVQQQNDLLYAVVTNMDAVRYSHPNAHLIGQHFIGADLKPALQGKENLSINHGVLAEAMRVFTPIYNSQHQQIGVVIVGISLQKVDQQISAARWNAVWFVLFSAIVGLLGVWGLVRVLKNILFGLEPHEISSLFEQRQAMLQSIREGVIAVDGQGRVTLINQAARQILFSVDAPALGAVQHAPLLDSLKEVLVSGTPIEDREIGCNGRLLLCSTVPVLNNKRVIGAISTFRDKTEISQLMQRMDGLVNYVDALRSHSHEFMNKLHVILGLLHMKRYDKLGET